MREKLPLIALICLFILVIINFAVDDQLIVGIVGVVLFIFVLSIRIFSKSREKQ